MKRYDDAGSPYFRVLYVNGVSNYFHVIYWCLRVLQVHHVLHKIIATLKVTKKPDRLTCQLSKFIHKMGLVILLSFS